jgi:hypothetical protein
MQPIVLAFEDIDKSTLVDVFLKIATLNNNYPKTEYSGVDFFKDTNRILTDLETGSLI